jgi:hypothetical protein
MVVEGPMELEASSVTGGIVLTGVVDATVSISQPPTMIRSAASHRIGTFEKRRARPNGSSLKWLFLQTNVRLRYTGS